MRKLWLLACLLLLAGCGGDGADATPQTYRIKVVISGLQGSLVLTNNGSDSLTLDGNGSFSFSQSLNDGASYQVSLQSQPPGQQCNIINGSGQIDAADVNSISVECINLSYTLGGIVEGLIGELVLQTNTGESLVINQNGDFTFTEDWAHNATYSVSVQTQPQGQLCSISQGAGLVNAADVNAVSVDCVTLSYAVGGTISGLQGELQLLNNGGDSMTVSSNGGFNFSQSLLYQSNYSVSILSQPVDQQCFIARGNGVVPAGDVTDIEVTCRNLHYIGGTVTGMTAGDLVVQNNASEILSISANGSFRFDQRVVSGGLYNIEITSNPVSQICSISNDSGEVADADIVDVDILCTPSNVSVTLSGSYQITPLTRIDSDINDPTAPANIPNNDFASAQDVPNFSRIHGFATYPGTGRTADGDRFASIADEWDVYRVPLQAGQNVRLQVVDYAVGGEFQGDLDLYLFDSDFNITDFSYAEDSEFEVVTATADSLYIGVQAWSGSSKYTLALDTVSSADVGHRQSMDFVPREAIVRFDQSQGALAFRADLTALQLSHQQTDRATLARFDMSAASSQLSQQSAVSPSVEAQLGQVNADALVRYKTLQRIKQLRLRDDVAYAEPNYLYHPLLTPNDSYYALQWHYPAINLPAAWEITTGQRDGSDVVVAVVDTGVMLAHPELSSQLVDGYDFISDSNNALDGDGIDPNPDDPGDSAQINSSSWHGTHVAGTIAAQSNNSSGIAGVAWNAKIMPLRVLGQYGGSSYDIIQAIRYAAGLSNDSDTVPPQIADIINLSLGGGGYSQASQEAYAAVRAAGVLVVAAAGNENSSDFSYPASYDGVISVSATDFLNQRAPYSNYGSRVDVAAPGGNSGVDENDDGYGDGVLSTLVDDSSGERTPTYSFYQGTSMATPHVAGVLALMRSVYPELSPDDVDALLSAEAITNDLGVSGRDDVYGYGLINSLKAVQIAQQLAAGGELPPQPAFIVATPSQLGMGSDETTALVALTNEGEAPASVISVETSAPWLAVSAATVDGEGLGSYEVSIDRTGLADALYAGSITFNLDTGDDVVVSVSMRVGSVDISGDVGQVYLLLLDTNFNVVDNTVAVDQGNGVYDYSFSGVSAGQYFVLGGSDIDNDLFICQLGEACGGYPTLDQLTAIDVLNTDIGELDFLVDILSNFGISHVPAGSGLNPQGLPRPALPARQLAR